MGERSVMGIMPTDDIISLLRQDHEAVQERFSEFRAAPPDARLQLFWELTEQLVRHEVAEEVVVYPAVREEPGGPGIADARVAEEAESERLLAHLERVDPMSEEFLGALRDLESAVVAHAQKEEAEVFPLLAANQATDFLSLLGQKFKSEKLAAPSRPHPHVPNSPVAQRLVGPVAAFIDRIRDASRETSGKRSQ
jgi:hemerythrin superfamily protein